MIGVLKWTPAEWGPLTLRELTIAHDAAVLEKWDHTALTASLIHNLSIIVISAVSKKANAKPKSLMDYHPYRQKEQQGLKLTPDNIGVLKQVAQGVVR